MRLILAESGSEIETSNKFLRSHDVKDLMELQKEVHNRANIKPADQILLSLNGIQIKPTAQDTNTLWQQINVVEEQLWGKKLVADRQDTLVVFNRRYITMQQFESTPIDDSFLLLVDEGSNSKYFDANLSKHYNGEIPSWNLMNAWFDGKLTKNSFEINPEKILTNLNNRKMKTLSNISKLTSETRNHYIALSAALHNLESHVRTAEETVNKFNRIAQREFSKQAAALTAMDLDTRLIQQIKIHPYILESIVTVDGVKSSALTTEAKESSTSATATPSQESFLIDYAAPLEQLREAKQALQKRFDELTLATTEQTNKIQFIHKQANQIRNCENFVCFTSTEEAEEFEGYSQLWGSSEKKINERLIKEPAFIATNENRKTVNRELILSLKVAYTCEMGSRDHEASTKMKKQKAWNAFVQGMQKISQIEQSISHVYPKLAELEQKVKALRLELEKGQGALIRRIITGYGVLLIELWRREQYSQIVSENADLLSDLFQQFGEREQRYRHAFNNKEIVCLEDATQLFFSERANDKKPALLPFKVKGLNDLPILSQTTLTQQKDVGQMTSTVLKKGTAISRKDIEALIKFISTFYAESINQHEESEFLKDIISPILQQKFERETTRLNRALMHLGLPDPGQHQQKKKLNGLHASTAEPSPNTIKDFASSSSLPSPFSPSLTTATSSILPSRSISSPPASSDKMKVATPSPSLRLFSTSPFFRYQSQVKDMDLQSDKQQQLLTFIEELRSKQEKDRVKYEKDRASLLRELDAKEKRLAEMHTDYECQISALHSKIEYDKADFEKRMEEIENDFRDKLQVEQRNCDRRMSTLFQRMEEKDEEISQLVMQQKQLAETASSNSPDNDTAYPRLPLSIDLGKTDKNSDTVQAKDERDYIELQSVIEQLKNQQAQADDTICQLQQEIKSYQNKLNKQSTNTELTESRLQQLFMDENTQKMMHAEARVENLKSEQEQTIQELEEVHKSEKRVLKIQYETQLDQITKAQRQQLQKQLTELEDERDRLRKENNLLKKESETLQKQNTDYRKCAKESTQTQKELHTLQQENKQAIILAKELLSILSGNESEDDSASLSNMLRKVIRSATMLQYRSGGTADQYGENKSYDDHYYY